MLTPQARLLPGVLLALLVAAPAARADTVELANGNRFTGAIIEEDANTITVLSDGVHWTVKRDEVTAVRRDSATSARARAREDNLRKNAFKEVAEPEKDEAEAKERVILYSTAWCGYCTRAREFLQARGVEFEEKDVEKDRAGRNEMERKKRKARIQAEGVPVIDVRGTLVMGFDPARLDYLLQGGKPPRQRRR